MRPINEHRVTYSLTLKNFELDLPRSMRAFMHQVTLYIRHVEGLTLQLRITFFYIYTCVNSISQRAAVPNFLFTSSQHHILETQVDNNPNATFTQYGPAAYLRFQRRIVPKIVPTVHDEVFITDHHRFEVSHLHHPLARTATV